MSFQGNVAGLGLAEVLQSIARADKEGVLHLDAEELQARLGMRDRVLFALPAPNEEDDLWRQRCQTAWADDPQPELETRRRRSIERCARIESLHQLLKASNVRFRFEPGSLAAWESYKRPVLVKQDGASAADDDEMPFGPGISVEFFLLEHARLHDESVDSGATSLSAFDVARALDVQSRPEQERPFLSHCDGASTLAEIADRMGWTLTQALATVGDYLEVGALRMARPRELLVLCQRELALGRTARARARLTGWVRRCAPGPLQEGDLELVLAEWAAGRLAALSLSLRASDARALLRRLDLSSDDPRLALERWQALREKHRQDGCALVRELVWRARAGVPCDSQGMNELLRTVRQLQDRGQVARARTLLRLVATQTPEKLATRLELGSRLVESGLVEEGSRWIVEGARELLGSQQPERALAPLRAVLRADPNHRAAHGLLIEAHARFARRRRRRFGLIIGSAIATLLSGVGFVTRRSQVELEAKLAEVTERFDEPQAALAILERNFGDDDSVRITALRSSIERRMRMEADELRADWLERYGQVMQECELGDPLLGLVRALEIPRPPSVESPFGGWPLTLDLLNAVANQLQRQADELAPPTDAGLSAVHAEERLLARVAEVLEHARAHSVPALVSAFVFRVEGLHAQLVARSARRARERERAFQTQQMREQDILLAAARAHARANDFERAIQSYDRLLTPTQASADAEELRRLFGAEAEGVERHWAGYKRALALAEAGNHAGARAALEPVCPALGEHLLPFTLRTLPAGARATSSKFGVRTAPLRVQSAFGERFEITLEREGFDPRVVAIAEPRDLVVHLHAASERAWASGARIDAVPLAVGADHIVADRGGRIARLATEGGRVVLRWTRTLESLGGIARAPLLLSAKPGFLLVVSEDGDAWLVDAESGAAEGPWRAGSPPSEGPTHTRDGAALHLADGRVAVWSDALVPEVFQGERLYTDRPGAAARERASETFALLRPSATEEPRLASPFAPWVVHALQDEYRVTHTERAQVGFALARVGDWTLFAWEAPNALSPEGRLWIADGAGLRAWSPERVEPSDYGD